MWQEQRKMDDMLIIISNEKSTKNLKNIVKKSGKQRLLRLKEF